MDEALERLKTEYRLGKPVVQGSGVQGSFDEKAVDCPFVFRHNERFYMMYIGFDGVGYQTGLAASDNLLEWKHEGLLLGRLDDPSRWDHVGAAGSWIILNANELADVPTLRKIDGKYWMIYHAYPEVGYESGGAAMGLAYCEDESLLEWTRLENPVYTYEGGAAWEQGGLYKCCVIRHEERYWMFYNAKEKDEWPWTEETGVAWSDDLVRWTRYADNPVMGVKAGSFYSQFFSDPYIKSDGGRWYNFGFGVGEGRAQGALAVSDDLLHWDILQEPWLPVGTAGELDETHAHKSCLLEWEGVRYHFYCAVRPAREGDAAFVDHGEGVREFRCITVAASRPWPTEQ